MDNPTKDAITNPIWETENPNIENPKSVIEELWNTKLQDPTDDEIVQFVEKEVKLNFIDRVSKFTQEQYQAELNGDFTMVQDIDAPRTYKSFTEYNTNAEQPPTEPPTEPQESQTTQTQQNVVSQTPYPGFLSQDNGTVYPINKKVRPMVQLNSKNGLISVPLVGGFLYVASLGKTTIQLNDFTKVFNVMPHYPNWNAGTDKNCVLCVELLDKIDEVNSEKSKLYGNDYHMITVSDVAELMRAGIKSDHIGGFVIKTVHEALIHLWYNQTKKSKKVLLNEELDQADLEWRLEVKRHNELMGESKKLVDAARNKKRAIQIALNDLKYGMVRQ